VTVLLLLLLLLLRLLLLLLLPGSILSVRLSAATTSWLGLVTLTSPLT
jgi:hypothetical protein